jgi:hypothetical protein
MKTDMVEWAGTIVLVLTVLIGVPALVALALCVIANAL